MRNGTQKLIALKDYCKTLLELGLHDAAGEVINASLVEMDTLHLPELKHKFLVLLSMATNDLCHAECVVSTDDANKEIRLFACRHIMDYYSSVGDAESLLRYYKIEQSLSLDTSSIKGKEVL